MLVFFSCMTCYAKRKAICTRGRAERPVLQTRFACNACFLLLYGLLCEAQSHMYKRKGRAAWSSNSHRLECLFPSLVRLVMRSAKPYVQEEGSSGLFFKLASPGMLVSFSCTACYVKRKAICTRGRAKWPCIRCNKRRRGWGHLALGENDFASGFPAEWDKKIKTL